MLEAREISVVTTGVNRLTEMTVDLQVGQLTALIGPNGAGKTTLLECLAGSLLPATGQVLLDGKPLSEWTALELAQKRAVLPQHSTLSFPFSVLEVVLMGRTPYWLGQKESKVDLDIAVLAMEATDCLHLQHQYFTRLSGGEQQRVQLARVLAQVWTSRQDNPAYLLLDEPVSALDLSHQFSLMKFLQEFARQGAGVCIVMHNLNLVKQYADRVWVVSGGKLVENGAIDTCLNADLIQQVFGVSADAVLVP